MTSDVTQAGSETLLEQTIASSMVVRADSGPTKEARSQPSRMTLTKMKPALGAPCPPPQRWMETYNAITEMREKVPAPVDGMGCANAGDAEINPKVRGVR